MALVNVFCGMTLICGAVAAGNFIAYKSGKYPNGMNMAMDAMASGMVFGFAALFGLFFI